MIIVKVMYTVRPDYVQKNQQNIHLFMDEFKKMDSQDFRYNVYLMADGKTFVHLSHYKNEEIQKQLLAVPIFVEFQKQRDASDLEGIPKIENLNFIAASDDFFDRYAL